MSVTSSDDPDRPRAKREPLPSPPLDDLNRAGSVASLDELGRPKPRKDQPLPDIPKQVAHPEPSPPPAIDQNDRPDNDDDDEQDENPYDYAVVRGEGEAGAAGIDGQPEVPPDSKRPGSYAKVTRHSDPPNGATDPNNPYAKVRDFGNRNRSATDPVNPSTNMPPPLPRTMTVASSNLPLPLPPRDKDQEEEDDTYDSIDKINKKPEAYEDEGNGMYESVPEDLKESLVNTSSSPIPIPPRSPRPPNLDNTPSPTKRVAAETAPSGSPTTKKATKRDKKKGNRSDSASSPVNDDNQKKHFQLFGRKRSSSSTNVLPTPGKGKGKKQQNSPEHVFRILTGPPPGMDGSSGDQEPVAGSRESPDRFAEAKKKAASLPREAHVNRTSLYNPHVNEPLPEVPEDSGSGSAAPVTRERVLEPADPSYDTVVTKLSSRHDEDEDEQEDNYDTVASLKQSRPALVRQSLLPPSLPNDRVSDPLRIPVPPTPTDEPEPDAEYAVVDPSVIQRKRAASMNSKQTKESDPPYDRVKKVEMVTSKSLDVPEPNDENEAGYEHVDPKVGQSASTEDGQEGQYAQINMVQKRIDRINKRLSSTDVEPSSPPAVPPIGYLDDRPDSETPPLPERTVPLVDDEPPYSKIKKQDDDTEDETQREYEDIDDLLPSRRSQPPSLPAPRHPSVTQAENTSSGPASSRAADTNPQQPVYDSLEEQQPVYDTLDPVTLTEI